MSERDVVELINRVWAYEERELQMVPRVSHLIHIMNQTVRAQWEEMKRAQMRRLCA